MSHIKQEFLGPLRKGNQIINRLKCPKVHTIYEGSIAWTIDDNEGHTCWVEIKTIYMCPAGVSGLEPPNIGHRMQHQLLQILPTWMAPGVPLTMIMLPWFGVAVPSFEL